MRIRINSIVLGVFALLLGVSIVGCSAERIESTARDIEYVAGGAAPAGSHQPGAAAEAARVAVQTASAFNPAVAGIASLVGLIAGAVGDAVGKRRGKRHASKQAHTVIRELVDDIAAFRDPATPWTDDTRKLLETLGYSQAAAVEPLRPVAAGGDLTPMPVSLTTDERQDIADLVNSIVNGQRIRGIES